MVGRSSRTAEIGHDDHGSVSMDVLSLLGDRRRRNVLECLAGEAGAVALADLAADVAVREHGAARPEIPDEAIQRIATSLYHVHVPQLVDAGVVEYDRDRDLVRPSERTDRVHRALSVVDAATDA